MTVFQWGGFLRARPEERQCRWGLPRAEEVRMETQDQRGAGENRKRTHIQEILRRQSNKRDARDGKQMGPWAAGRLVAPLLNMGSTGKR